MIVVADNSPLSALSEIGLIDLLPSLYDGVTIPVSVSHEAMHVGAPASLRAWMSSPPAWLTVVPDPDLLPEVASLDPGEAAAISLAWQSRPEALVIVDDRAARRLCEALAIPCTGIAGLPLVAARAGLVDFEDAMQRLQATTFRLSGSVIEQLRRRL